MSRSAACIAFVFLTRAALALLVVPPWQLPDEPSHFVTARSARDGTLQPVPDVERAVLQSMRDYHWWEHYGQVTPAPLPQSFAASPLPFAGAPHQYAGPLGYYLAAGWLTTWFPDPAVVNQLYALRALSLASAVAALLCAWTATMRLLGPRDATLVTALLALHPQFLLVSATANPDAIVNFWGALLWWQTVELLRGERPMRALILLWVAAFGAALTKRLGITLVGHAAIVTAAYLFFADVPREHRLRALAALAVVGIGGVLAALIGTGEFQRVLLKATIELNAFVAPRAGSVDYLLDFTRDLFRSSWLMAGWMRYPAPPEWFVLAGAIVAAGLLGVPRALARAQRGERLVLLVGAFMLLVQTAAIYAMFFRLDRGSQGRYLMPLAVPAITLMWAGVRAWSGPREAVWLRPALIGAMAVLDLTGWTVVLLPAFLT